MMRIFDPNELQELDGMLLALQDPDDLKFVDANCHPGEIDLTAKSFIDRQYAHRRHNLEALYA